MATSQHVRSSAAAVLAAATATGTMFLGSAAPVSAQQATARAGVPILMFHVVGRRPRRAAPRVVRLADELSRTGRLARSPWLPRSDARRRLPALERRRTAAAEADRVLVRRRLSGRRRRRDARAPRPRLERRPQPPDPQPCAGTGAHVDAAGWEVDSHTFTQPDLGLRVAGRRPLHPAAGARERERRGRGAREEAGPPFVAVPAVDYESGRRGREPRMSGS
jgi:hypothetical protein